MTLFDKTGKKFAVTLPYGEAHPKSDDRKKKKSSVTQATFQKEGC